MIYTKKNAALFLRFTKKRFIFMNILPTLPQMYIRIVQGLFNNFLGNRSFQAFYDTEGYQILLFYLICC